MASSDQPIVFFDLESTGLDRYNDEIVQIGARCGSQTFMRYMMPAVEFDDDASRINGLTVRHGRLCKDGVPVRTTERKQAWREFVDFLDECGGDERVVLTAHNGFKFDIPFLLREFRNLGLLSDLLNVASHGSDTKQVFPEESRNLRLSAYAKQLGVKADNAHDAIADVDMMMGVCKKLGISNSDLRKVALRLDSFSY